MKAMRRLFGRSSGSPEPQDIATDLPETGGAADVAVRVPAEQSVAAAPDADIATARAATAADEIVDTAEDAAPDRDTHAALNRAVNARLIDIAYRNMAPGLIFHAAAIFFVTLVAIEDAPPVPFIAWVFCAVSMIFVRTALYMYYFKNAGKSDDKRPWIMRFSAVSMLSK